MRSSPGHRRNAAGLAALVALVLVAFAAGGYLYTSSTRPAPTQRTDAAHEERAVGTAGVNGDARPEGSDKPDPDVAQRAATPAEKDTRDRNITGRWTVATRIDQSRVEAFRGLRLGYVVNLRQDGERVTGDGRKITENGTRLQAGAQTPISVVGTVAGDQLNLTFTERGARRQSTGTFVLRRAADGSLKGSFSSNAARSSGAAEAHRQ